MNFEYGLDRNIFDIALDVFCSCCYSVEEANKMETLFREEFRVKCYEMAINGKAASVCMYVCEIVSCTENRWLSIIHFIYLCTVRYVCIKYVYINALLFINACQLNL